MFKSRLVQTPKLLSYASQIFFFGWFVLFYFPRFSWQMNHVWFKLDGLLSLFLCLFVSLLVAAFLCVRIKKLIPQYFFSRFILFCAMIFLFLNWNTFSEVQNFMGEWRLKVKKTPFLMESILASPGSNSFDRERFFNFASTYTKDRTLYVSKNDAFRNKLYHQKFSSKSITINPKDTLLNEESIRKLLDLKHIGFLYRGHKFVFIMDKAWSSAKSIYIYKGLTGGYFVFTDNLFEQINLNV